MHTLVVGTEVTQGRGRCEKISAQSKRNAIVLGILWNWIAGLFFVSGKIGDYHLRRRFNTVWHL